MNVVDLLALTCAAHIPGEPFPCPGTKDSKEINDLLRACRASRAVERMYA